MDRRRFLQTGSVLTAASFARVAGAADRVRVGLIGSGGRGQLLAGQFKEFGADVVAVCDVYDRNLQDGLAEASTGAKSYTDYRRLLEDKSLDAVIVATPDHWHARMAIDAAGAGKDIYIEKPMAHTIDEGYAIVKAVRGAKRIAQIGVQRRSSDFFMEAKGVMDSGKLGEIRMVSSQWLNNQTSLSAAKFEGNIDWKAWLGSAPARPADPQRFFNWYYFFDYGGGMLVGQAAHIIDAIQWFMNAKDPLAVTCVGGRSHIPGVEVSETAVLTVEFPEFLATFTISYKAMRYSRYNDQWKQFHGATARFDVGREWYKIYPETRKGTEFKPSAEKADPGAFDRANGQHVANFLDCVRTRKEPNAPVEAGQATNIVLCLALDSLRSGRRQTWTPKA